MQNIMTYKDRIKAIKDTLTNGLLEKDEAIALSLLCMIAGKSIFFYGPPGTAKSLVARRISCAFKSNKFFDYLMNRFSTPEEIFGPLSLKELRADKLIRQTKGFLPEADFAFLDEIWKSSPAILNALLTIINEKKFRNGENLESVPLRGLIAASNELPQKGQSLEALYDRFIMRLIVPRLEKKDNFKKLLQARSAVDSIEIDENLKFSSEDLEQIKLATREVEIDESVLSVLEHFKNLLELHNKAVSNNTAESSTKDSNADSTDSKEIIDVSERRWIAIMDLLRFSAVLNDRNRVILGDVLLIKHCLWSSESQKKEIEKLLGDAFGVASPKFEIVSENLVKLQEATIYQEDILDKPIIIEDNKYYTFDIDVPEWGYGVSYASDITKTFCIDAAVIQEGQQGREIFDNKCKVCEDGRLVETRGMVFEYNPSHNYIEFHILHYVKKHGWYSRHKCKNHDSNSDYKPYLRRMLPIKFHKGDKKSISAKLKDTYLKECDEIISIYETKNTECKNLQNETKKYNQNIFITQSKDYNALTKSLRKTQREIIALIKETQELREFLQSANVEEVSDTKNNEDNNGSDNQTTLF